MSNPKLKLRYDMFININNPDFNASKVRQDFHDQYMTAEEKKAYQEKKDKIEKLLRKISKEQKAKSAAIKAKDDEEFERRRQVAKETLENARSELIKQAEELRMLEVQFRKQIYKEHLQTLENNKDMAESLKAREIDLTNYAEYVQEFYDKMNNNFIKDYEFRIKDLERINAELEVKRAQYEEFKYQTPPPEDPIAKIVVNHEKLDSYKHHDENTHFKRLGNSPVKGRFTFVNYWNLEVSSTKEIINPFTASVSVLLLIIGYSIATDKRYAR